MRVGGRGGGDYVKKDRATINHSHETLLQAILLKAGPKCNWPILPQESFDTPGYLILIGCAIRTSLLFRHLANVSTTKKSKIYTSINE